jgi:hypothetical protein
MRAEISIQQKLRASLVMLIMRCSFVVIVIATSLLLGMSILIAMVVVLACVTIFTLLSVWLPSVGRPWTLPPEGPEAGNGIPRRPGPMRPDRGSALEIPTTEQVGEFQRSVHGPGMMPVL